MLNNDIHTIISNALAVKKESFSEHVKSLIEQIKKALEINQDALEQASRIDHKNENGFLIDFSVIKRVFSHLEKEHLYYGDVTLSQKDDNLLYGTQVMDCGNVVVVNDGNPYVIIEMAIRNMMAGNTVIFSNNGYMLGTNQLIIQIIQSILEQFSISKHFVQIYLSEEFDELLNNYANIDLVVCIGNHNLQNMILNKSRNKTIVSGYENFDVYIEDASHLDFLNTMMNTGCNIQLYIHSDLSLDHPDAIIVSDIDEAIAQINYNGSKYSSAIFTTSTEHASQFIKEVKSKMVTVNTSPTIERILDIQQRDLINEKTIVYPFGFQLDGTNETIPLKQES